MAAVIGNTALRSAFVALVASMAAGISAQQNAAPPDPVIVHFREYRAALERNDLPTAETAAAAALAASQAANGPRTAVLALNLANLRLELGGDHDALTPARTAHGLATASASSGVDPAAAALTLGRAEIAGGEAAGSARLLETLAAVGPNSALETDAYSAAVELGALGDPRERLRRGAASMGNRRTALAHHAGPRVSARSCSDGRRRIDLPREQRSLAAGAAGAAKCPRRADAKTASDAFAIAQRLLMPAAYANTPSGAGLTVGQVAYAEAMAWQSALFAKLQSRGIDLPEDPTFGADVPPFDADAQCKMRSIREGGELSYPPDVLSRFGVGSVVVHFGLDSAGAVTSHAVAAAIPAGALAKAVEDVADEWRIERDPSSARGCRIPPSAYVNVRFVLD